MKAPSNRGERSMKPPSAGKADGPPLRIDRWRPPADGFGQGDSELFERSEKPPELEPPAAPPTSVIVPRLETPAASSHSSSSSPNVSWGVAATRAADEDLLDLESNAPEEPVEPEVPQLTEILSSARADVQ